MNQQIDFDVLVIGGGIIGLASAYKIAKNHPGISLAVVEKEDKLAAHQTSHNSGVIHSGLYYQPGLNKAKTCIEGRKKLVAFAKKYKIPYRICGKIIVAARKKELKNLELIFRNGLENGIEGIEKISPDEIEEIEPFCRGIAGIKVPCTGVIDFASVAEKLGELIQDVSNSNKILLSNEVLRFEKHDFFTKVITDKITLKAGGIINCAGLQSDKIAKLDNVRTRFKIIPFRGGYYELTAEAAEKVKNLIYPVPDLALPFLGVHFTRGIDNKVECGPNAVFAFKKEGYRKASFSFKDSWNSLSFPGTWKLFLKNCRYGLSEYARAFSKDLFVQRLQRLIPTLRSEDIKPGKAGIRAQAVDYRGRLIDDFEIRKNGNCIHVLNTPSPAATASLTIGEHISQIAEEHFKLTNKVTVYTDADNK